MKKRKKNINPRKFNKRVLVKIWIIILLSAFILLVSAFAIISTIISKNAEEKLKGELISYSYPSPYPTPNPFPGLTPSNPAFRCNAQDPESNPCPYLTCFLSTCIATTEGKPYGTCKYTPISQGERDSIRCNNNNDICDGAGNCIRQCDDDSQCPRAENIGSEFCCGLNRCVYEKIGKCKDKHCVYSLELQQKEQCNKWYSNYNAYKDCNVCVLFGGYNNKAACSDHFYQDSITVVGPKEGDSCDPLGVIGKCKEYEEALTTTFKYTLECEQLASPTTTISPTPTYS